MFEQGINNDTKRVLGKIGSIVSKDGFYLAGGTALSLQLGHRESVDLDFFNINRFTIDDLIKNLEGFSVIDKKPGTLIGTIDKVSVSFFEYRYPLLFEPIDYNEIKVASILDISLMKLSAILSRNTKKDFIDLYYICKTKYRLNEILKEFNSKFVKEENLILPILKSLTYFVETEKEPLPKMFIETDWEEVKTYFKTEVKKITNNLS